MNIVFLELGSVPSEIQLQSSKTQFKIGKGAEMGLTSKIKETLETNVKLKPLHIKRHIFRKSILLKSIVLLEQNVVKNSTKKSNLFYQSPVQKFKLLLSREHIKDTSYLTHSARTIFCIYFFSHAEVYLYIIIPQLSYSSRA